MPSRMERYYQTNEEKDVNLRSKLNEDLYRRIYEEVEYSNMEVIADIETTNEIDITKIKDILNKREDYQKEKEIRQIIKRPTEILEQRREEQLQEEKVYDIRDILTKAKDERETEDYHSLKNTQFDILKGIKLKDIENAKEENELKELFNTITNTSLLNKMDNKDLSLDLLNDLQSSGHTIITNTDSMKKILEEPEEKEEDITIIDKSFYTTSANFANEDFEELKEMSSAIKKNNFLIKMLIFMLLVTITVSMIYIVYTLTK